MGGPNVESRTPGYVCPDRMGLVPAVRESPSDGRSGEIQVCPAILDTMTPARAKTIEDRKGRRPGVCRNGVRPGGRC